MSMSRTHRRLALFMGVAVLFLVVLLGQDVLRAGHRSARSAGGGSGPARSHHRARRSPRHDLRPQRGDPGHVEKHGYRVRQSPPGHRAREDGGRPGSGPGNLRSGPAEEAQGRRGVQVSRPQDRSGDRGQGEGAQARRDRSAVRGQARLSQGRPCSATAWLCWRRRVRGVGGPGVPVRACALR